MLEKERVLLKLHFSDNDGISELTNCVGTTEAARDCRKQYKQQSTTDVGQQIVFEVTQSRMIWEMKSVLQPGATITTSYFVTS